MQENISSSKFEPNSELNYFFSCMYSDLTITCKVKRATKYPVIHRSLFMCDAFEHFKARLLNLVNLCCICNASRSLTDELDLCLHCKFSPEWMFSMGQHKYEIIPKKKEERKKRKEVYISLHHTRYNLVGQLA